MKIDDINIMSFFVPVRYTSDSRPAVSGTSSLVIGLYTSFDSPDITEIGSGIEENVSGVEWKYLEAEKVSGADWNLESGADWNLEADKVSGAEWNLESGAEWNLVSGAEWNLEADKVSGVEWKDVERKVSGAEW